MKIHFIYCALYLHLEISKNAIINTKATIKDHKIQI